MNENPGPNVGLNFLLLSGEQSIDYNTMTAEKSSLSHIT